jgi:hypothetical protein
MKEEKKNQVEGPTPLTSDDLNAIEEVRGSKLGDNTKFFFERWVTNDFGPLLERGLDPLSAIHIRILDETLDKLLDTSIPKGVKLWPPPTETEKGKWNINEIAGYSERAFRRWERKYNEWIDEQVDRAVEQERQKGEGYKERNTAVEQSASSPELIREKVLRDLVKEAGAEGAILLKQMKSSERLGKVRGVARKMVDKYFVEAGLISKVAGKTKYGREFYSKEYTDKVDVVRHAIEGRLESRSSRRKRAER